MIISRADVEDLIKNNLQSDEQIILTGMDASGKTTFLLPYFADYPVLKIDSRIGRAYMRDIEEVGINISWYLDKFNLYKFCDRHILTDYLIYANAYMIHIGQAPEDSIRNDIDYYINNYPDFYESRIFIIFSCDKYFNVKPHENEWVSEERPLIGGSFRYLYSKISEINDKCYLVID